MSKPWMIYGAYGYTGELIAREAARRGLRPTLAGRDASRVEALARELELPHRAFGLSNGERLREGIAGMALVLHCAGPFSATARPMMEACLQAGAHYLDITGEIGVFEHAASLDGRARKRSVVICPGVGFDVVPTDCLALALSEACPDAKRLALGFDSRGRMSPGTAKTSVEGLANGGAVRRDGHIVRVPLAWRTRRIDFGDGEKLAMTIPWGDVSTAFYTTGIPDIEVYIPASEKLVARLKRMNFVRPLLGLGPVQRFMKSRIDKSVRGPGEEQRAKAPTWVWGEVESADGRRATGRIRVANGYDVTVAASLAIAEHVLGTPASGHFTPARLMGRDFVTTLPDSGPMEID
ncbi:MAG: saccharopine dehydrogenase NADP-binding domain-containing protein [Gammaproteobacteria bacterium]